MKGRTIKKVFLLVLLLVSSVVVEGKEDVEIIGKDMDSSGLASSYTVHDFYISGVDAAYLDHICWKYILPSSDGKENVVIQKVTRKSSLSHKSMMPVSIISISMVILMPR